MMRAMRLKNTKLGRVCWTVVIFLACVVASLPGVLAEPVATPDSPPPIYDPQLLSFGPWSYTDDDNPAFALPDQDLSRWKPVEAGRPYQALSTGVRWYRTEFTIGWQYRTRNMGIGLGKVQQAHQVYINGQLVGSEGGSGKGFVDAGRKSGVFPVAGSQLWFSFLSFTRPNVLAVRVETINAPLKLDVAEVQIDDLDKLLLESRTSDTYVKIAEGGALSVLTLIGVFCGFLFLSGVRGHANKVFGLLVLFSSLSIFTDSLLLYDLGWKTAPAQRMVWLFQVAAVVAYVRMVRVELRHETSFWERMLEYASLAVALLIVVWPSFLETPMATPVVVGLPVVTVVPAVLLSFAALRRSIPDSIALFFTALLLLASAAGIPFLLFSSPPLFPLHLGLFTCAVILLLPTARQFDEMMRREIVLSRRLVNVRDLERTRLARDMHDGIGQSLAAVSLQLRLLMRNADDPRMKGLAESVNNLTGELREVIGNLRPSNLQDLPLGRVIEMHFIRTLSDSGIGFTSGKIEDAELPLDTKEHLFRIYQEALHNALRHSNCSNLNFSQKRMGRYLRLSISDDGCGFRISAEKNKGLGLSTMRERALLINANLEIVSSPDEGTTVSIKVPIS